MVIDHDLERCAMYETGHPVARRATRMVAGAMWSQFGVRPIPGTKGQVTFPGHGNFVCIEMICATKPSMTMSLRGPRRLYRGLRLEPLFVSPRPGCTRLRIHGEADVVVPLIAFLRAAMIVSGRSNLGWMGKTTQVTPAQGTGV